MLFLLTPKRTTEMNVISSACIKIHSQLTNGSFSMQGTQELRCYVQSVEFQISREREKKNEYKNSIPNWMFIVIILFFSCRFFCWFHLCNQRTHFTPYHLSRFRFVWLEMITIFFFVHLMFMGHDVCVCVRNNRQMIAYQFDLRKMYIFWSLFASTCNSIRFPRFQCACSRLNSLSHSIRVKSPNIIIIDIGTAATA